ncbi:MAG TPA: hypothetical protein VGH27_35225 [Streptosporangiaceae bacterium]
MKFSRKAAALTAAATVAAGLAVGIAGAADASSGAPAFGGGTGNCAHGLYAGYCGTQESGTGLYIAADWQGRIIGTRTPQASNAEFFWFADGTTAGSHNKYAEFAPGGVASNKVMAEVRGRVVLAPANGANTQKWLFDGTGWENVGTGDVLKSTSNGGPVLAVNGPSSGQSETWTFVTP